MGYDNWESKFPWRLSKSLDNFTDSIQPPRRSSTIERRLEEATKKYKRDIHRIMINEISTSAIQQLEQLRQISASSSDWQLAADTAARQIRRSHKHIVPALLQPLINKVILFIRDNSNRSDIIKRYFPQLTYYARNTSTPTESIDTPDEYVVLSETTSTPSDFSNDTEYVVLSSTTLTPPPVVSNIDSTTQATAAEHELTIDDIILYSPLVENEPSTPAAETDNQVVDLPPHPSPLPQRPRIHNSRRRSLPTTPVATTTASSSPLSRPQATTSPVAADAAAAAATATTADTDVTASAAVVPPPSSSSPTSAAAAATAAAATVDNIRPYYYCHHQTWRIKPESRKYTTLVIADSNGKRWRDAPDDWVIYSFSGMRLSDVSQIMSRSLQLIQQYDRLIIHCGRNDTFFSVNQHFIKFVSYINSVTHPPITIVPSLIDPEHHEPGLVHLRRLVGEEFAENAVLFNEPQLYVRLRPSDLKHYRRSTAHHLIADILDHLN
ncbi:hypothetical protein HC928_17825 [bacterium]|nr:hypothetical protein [bacterium]